MLSKFRSILPGARLASFAPFAIAAMFAAPASSDPAQAAETVLYSFKGQPDGANPASLISDTRGALYGMTKSGGNSGHGAVFKLAAPAAGQTQWTESILYRFSSNGAQDELIFDTQGALYGTAQGSVFKLTPPPSGTGQWTETTLYTFNSDTDGSGCCGTLIFDTQGALYGTTFFGWNAATPGSGMVYKLAPPAFGTGLWTRTVLYKFKGGTDAANPYCPLIFDTRGALYGVTQGGGSSKAGAVFKLTPPVAGQTQWTESVLYSFKGGTDGFGSGSLTFDHQGALYGMTSGVSGLNNGVSGAGVVFKLTPPASGTGQWTETVLHSFPSAVGGAPGPSLIFDTQGSLYGTTYNGGSSNGGTAFKLSPPNAGTGPWTESVLYNFPGNAANQYAGPHAGLIFGPGGILYGTTYAEGQSGKGAVFQLSRPSCP